MAFSGLSVCSQVPVQVEVVPQLEPQGMVGRLLMKHFKSAETPGFVHCCYFSKSMRFDGSNGTGIERHLKNFHKKEFAVFEADKKEEKANVLENNNNAKAKKRGQETKPKDGNPKMKQAKFAWTIEDKELQNRWDDAIVDYASDSFSSYKQLSSQSF